MKCARIYPIVACLASMVLAAQASAHRMDYDLAGAGTRTSYSEMVNAIPTAWDVMVNRTPLTSPTVFPHESALPAGIDLAENGSSGMLGQIVRVGHPNGASRHVWGVYDRLSRIATPFLLYYHSGALPRNSVSPWNRPQFERPWLGNPAGIRGTASASSGRAAPTPTLLDQAVAIPEPTALMLSLIGGTVLIAQRRR
jgi:hypothetical protein